MGFTLFLLLIVGINGLGFEVYGLTDKYLGFYFWGNAAKVSSIGDNSYDSKVHRFEGSLPGL